MKDFSGARDDDHLIQLWLSGRPASTQRVYKTAVLRFQEALGQSIRNATVADVVAWMETLEGKPATRARLVSTVKSLLSYAHRTGYTAFNVGRALRCVRVPSHLHERIVDEKDIKSVLRAADPGRNRTLVRLFYASGLRVSEVVSLRWVDLGKGHLTVQGKGARARTIVVPEAILEELRALREVGDQGQDPVFRSCRGLALGVRDAREIVYKSAEKAGVSLSPHWFRHAHASHALDHGCPIHVLSKTLGHANISTTSVYLHVKPNQGSSQFLPAF